MRSRFFLALAALALIGVSPAFAQKEFELTPDSLVQPGVPQGEVRHLVFKQSKVFPGTERDVWVYIPRQYDAKTPACLMVCQDGIGFRIPTVFDNLIAKGEMPVTIAIMATPGVVPAGENQLPRYNRSVEYDGMDERFATFLIDELIPFVKESQKLNLTNDPRGRAICGASSGGIAAFTAAWERPDYFSKVFGVVSSFTDLRGGHVYPTLIRKREPKPLRIFLQDGVNDQDIYSGSWPIGNTDVVAALNFAGYDLKYVTGPGGHDGRQGTALLPDAMRWLWRGYPGGDLEPHNGSRQPVFSYCLIPGENWKPVSLPGAADALATDTDGNVFVAGGGKIVRIAPDGASSVLKDGVGKIGQLVVGPGGKLLASQPDRKRIVAWDVVGIETTVARGISVASFTVRHTGTILALEAVSGTLWKIDARGKKSQAGVGIPGATALCLTPDQSLLLVAPNPSVGKFGLSLKIGDGETLTDSQRYHDFYVAYGHDGAGVSHLAVDTNGWLYASSDIGIQMLDQAGRVNGIVANPALGPTSAVALGGKDRATLYTIQNGKLFARKTKAQGALLCQPPIKPPGPRL